MATTSKLTKFAVKILAEQLVCLLYESILDRPPDDNGLRSYTSLLRQTGDLRALASDLSHSDEAWEKSLALRPATLAASIFRGLLDREPTGQELDVIARQLTSAIGFETALNEITNSEVFRSARGLTELSGVLDQIDQFGNDKARASDSHAPQENSREFQSLSAALNMVLEQAVHSDRTYERTITIHAAKLVRTICCGLLDSEPDGDTLQSQSRKLRATGDLASVVKAVTQTRIRAIQEQVPSVDEMINSVYRGMLGRPADEDGLGAYRKLFDGSPTLEALSKVIADISQSRESFSVQIKKRSNIRFPPIFSDRPTWVFLHAEKTGGTSLQNMLRAAINPNVIYSEHADNLHLYPRETLAAFDVFAGHFNYDSVRFIPRNVINTTTILRDPYERLVSLYTFWRAHTPEAPSFNSQMEEAGRLDVHDFFTEARCLTTPFVWNHMVWCVMGNRRWRNYQQMLSVNDPTLRASRIQEIRLDISEQIRNFAFIGIQEQFPETCSRLFKMMDLKYSGAARHDQTVQELTQRDDKKFRYVVRPKRTPELDTTLSRLTELDQILYSEAKLRFEGSNQGL